MDTQINRKIKFIRKIKDIKKQNEISQILSLMKVNRVSLKVRYGSMDLRTKDGFVLNLSDISTKSDSVFQKIKNFLIY